MNSASVSPASRSNEKALRDTRAHAWAFAFECYDKKEGSRPGAPDDARKDENAGIHPHCT